ncbi:LysR family transcriptional regulator [Pseudidiomarina aestuarii]|uniref:LysR family transcriptional regulator n=1 Tax=Pseudidiomarina aestuarii TaxID=624146 RepID=A0A2T4D7P8_9GAMM|nr:LysR family transcriptional regulator [Pseudidiomarina aestuarii]PTB85411.1 LysR family transcriptional regulator [Pseudidiomarina aestuarii]PTB89843.1 LysR family transcriptional regulator [Pseudidiomarina aestuarii]
MDRLDAMRTFITVAREGSFTNAAERLGMSPQLVSKYVSQLEAHLGIRLLNRTTRRVNLTEAGRRYELSARQVLQDIDDLENDLGDLQSHATGQLRISAPVSFAIAHLAPLLSAFQEQYPAVTFDVQLNDRKVDIVDEGFDLALRIGQLKSSSLIAKRLAPVRLAICAAPDYLAKHGMPKSLEDLKQHKLLHYNLMEDDTSPLLKAWLQHRHTLISNNGDVLTRAAIAGSGLVIQPTFIVSDALATGTLVPVLSEHLPEPLALYAVYAHRTLLASKVRAFLDFSADYYGDIPPWDQALTGTPT